MAPDPPHPRSSPPPEPGRGNAGLDIDSEPALTYTLTCRGGAPTDESRHPYPAQACEVLRNDPEVLMPQSRSKDVVCTQQYGGPQTANVTGVVDGIRVDISFALRDGCEISQWNAAESILGPASRL